MAYGRHLPFRIDTPCVQKKSGFGIVASAPPPQKNGRREPVLASMSTRRELVFVDSARRESPAAFLAAARLTWPSGAISEKHKQNRSGSATVQPAQSVTAIGPQFAVGLQTTDGYSDCVESQRPAASLGGRCRYRAGAVLPASQRTGCFPRRGLVARHSVSGSGKSHCGTRGAFFFPVSFSTPKNASQSRRIGSSANPIASVGRPGDPTDRTRTPTWMNRMGHSVMSL